MKKTMRKLIALILAVCALVTTAMPAWATSLETPEDDPLVPEYVGISSLSCSCNVSSGTATCKGSVKLKSGYTCHLAMRLQRSNDKSSWSSRVIWMSQTATSMTKTQSVTSGSSYRVQLVVSVYNSSGSLVETVTLNSNVVYY